jgi:predicted O-methyltransferase YrrM
VDRYITGLLVPPDEAMDGALRDSVAASLPPIAVSPTKGKLLHPLARMQGAHLILEIGTLGGYSTIRLARALPAGGRLVTLEVDPRHAETARPISPAPDWPKWSNCDSARRGSKALRPA